MSEKKSGLTSMYTPVLVLLLIVGSFFIGRLSAQVSSLKDGTPAVAGAAVPSAAAPVGDPAVGKIEMPQLKAYAKEFGLDTGKFDKCLDDGANAARVSAEQKEGAGLGVSGTPSFMINGLLVVGALPQTSFEQIIDAELKDGSGAKVVETVTGSKVTRAKLAMTEGYLKGPKDAKIKLVEFTDFQCPYCVRAFPTIEGVLKKYEGKISIEYKSFPLSFHPYAQKAAEAALCAGEQGKFWEMHDKIFTVQK
jgi:protein-disulfide isomerase